LLSDYGYEDEFAGVCRAVIARIAPDAQVIDITHGVPRHDVRQGSFALAKSIPFAPLGVHVAIVDPGVGGERRPVALQVRDEDRLLVGPDNGVLAPAAERFGGARAAVDLTTSPHRLEPISATFHGRDLFAPVAARLALGAPLTECGETIDPTTLSCLELPQPRIEQGRVVAHVIGVDGFGNAMLDLGHDQLPLTFLRLGGLVQVDAGPARIRVPFGRTFADVAAGEGLLYEDSSRNLALAINRGNAAQRLGLAPDDEVVLRPG
jgi:S-adenosylmethionine hydrolase